MNFTIPSQDYAAHMLKMILGTLWTSIQSSGMNISGLSTANNWLGNMFLIFNAAVLTVATFYVTKVIYEGVAHSAVEGEWLGKNMSGFWAPLRVVMFLGLIAPVAGGYSMAQVIVLWTVSQSIGVADMVADAGMQTALAQGMVSNGSPTPSARNAAADMLRGMTCMATVNLAAKNAGMTPPIALTTTTLNGVTTTLYGGVKGTGVPANACGGFSISLTGNGLANVVSSVKGALGSPIPIPASMTTLIQQGLTSMETTLQPVATAIATQVNAGPAASGNGTPGNTTGGSSTLQPNQVSLAAQGVQPERGERRGGHRDKDNDGVAKPHEVGRRGEEVRLRVSRRLHDADHRLGQGTLRCRQRPAFRHPDEPRRVERLQPQRGTGAGQCVYRQ
ncbi:hypothetical protein AFERRI_40167 [Acidithiobacillus ferrivorans]|nr:hypothetical protein AFERRI_40167 [Acidithiobacillus ferrivorans]